MALTCTDERLRAKRRREAERDELARLDEQEVAHHYVAGEESADGLEREVEGAVRRRERAEQQLRREVEAVAVDELEWDRRARPREGRAKLVVGSALLAVLAAIVAAVVVLPVGPDVNAGRMASSVQDVIAAAAPRRRPELRCERSRVAIRGRARATGPATSRSTSSSCVIRS
jgi:hypothetical protein